MSMRAFLLRLRRRGVFLLAAAMLLSQWLAAVHSVVHLPGRGPVGVHERAAASDSSLAQAIVKLVASHDTGGYACQDLDHQCHAAPGAPAMALPASLPVDAGVPAPLTAARSQDLWGHYLARAPPAVA